MAKKKVPEAKTGTQDNKSKTQQNIDVNDKDKKPTRGLAITDNFGWTGKLPTSLFHETCQKNNWKPNYDIHKTNKGFFSHIRLAWMNPKTSSLVEIKLKPDHVDAKETVVEAKQFMATYALHKVNYNKNFRLVLPKIFKDYWDVLDDHRKTILKDSKYKHDLIYNAEPFKVFLLNENKKKSEPTDKSSGPTGSSTGKNYAEKFERIDRKWVNAPLFDLTPEVRNLIENSIRKYVHWDEDEDSTLKNVEPNYQKILLKLGFKQNHIDESLTHTKNITTSLEWLLFNIPEDDLPSDFKQDTKEANLKLKFSNDITKEKLVQKFINSGFAKNDIVLALAQHNEFSASCELTRGLVSYTATPVENIPEEDIWDEEVENLKMIYEDKIILANSEQFQIRLIPQTDSKSTELIITIIRCSNYPFNLTGIQIHYDSDIILPSYVKTSILKHLIAYTVDLVGDSYIYSIVDWIEENFWKIVENPGPLNDPKLVKEKHIPTQTSNGAKFQKKDRSFNVGKVDVAKIKKDYTDKLNSSNLKQKIKERSNLPAWNLKDSILKCVSENQITFVTGETGSGKSTQIVQFILDQLNSQGDFETSIICTQPRRISTIGLAERISDERCDSVGCETGYIIRGENKTGQQTRLSFVTTGVLLRIIQTLKTDKDKAKFFQKFKYIAIDEVHERSIDIDFLLIILKKLVMKYPVKIILMSATINLSNFEKFFASKLNHIHIKGRTFPIEDFYLDTILDDLKFTIKNNDGDWITPRANSNFFVNGSINYDLISQLVASINTNLNTQDKKGSILIFLPGIYEIDKCLKTIVQQNSDFWVLPLHSALSSNDQKKIFLNPPANKRKIIISTNIAETSITIPDCIVVIDSGRSKKIMYNANLNTTKLIENWCSKAEVNQRRGRSGRITNGTCYKLYTSDTQFEMLDQPIPEIKRTRLENLYLIIKSMGVPNVSRFLAEGLDAPDDSLIDKSKQFLIDIGAISDNDVITHLGTYLSLLPTDLQSGKLLIFGCIFNCIESCLTLAAIGTTGSPFLNGGDKNQTKQIKFSFGKGQGDLVSMVNAFNKYNSIKIARDRNRWINENNLSFNTLQEIKSTRLQYLNILKELGFIPLNYNGSNADLNKNNTNYPVLKSIITGSFYPQIAKVQYPKVQYVSSSVGSIQVDPDSKQNKFWIHNEDYNKTSNNRDQGDGEKIYPETRAFIHPSSILFSDIIDSPEDSKENAGEKKDEENARKDGLVDFSELRNRKMDLKPSSKTVKPVLKSSFIIYNNSQHTNKLYLRDITPTSTLSVLLFGGSIDYDMNTIIQGKKSSGIILDEWLHIRTWCKNAVLVKQLRIILDKFIQDKLSVPHYNDNYEQGERSNDILDIVEKILKYDDK